MFVGVNGQSMWEKYAPLMVICCATHTIQRTLNSDWITLRAHPVLSCPFWPCNHRMCVIAKRDWAVSTGLDMQQDMEIAKALPHMSAPNPVFEYRSRLCSNAPGAMY